MKHRLNPIVILVCLLSTCALAGAALSGFIGIRDGYFYDKVTGAAWTPHGIAYQTWNRPLGVWQTFQQIDYDLDEMVKMGANSIRVDFVWKQIEEKGNNQFDWTNYDYLVQAAEQRGLRIFALIGYQWPPDWFPNDWYTMHPPASDSEGVYHPARWQSDIINYEHPSAREQYAEWISTVCARYKNSKAVAGWIVGNESGYLGLWSGLLDGYDPQSEQAFRIWCSTKYGAISNANAAWGTAFTNFNQVTFPDEYRPYGQEGAVWADAVQWREDSIASFTALGAKAAKTADTNHLISYSTVGMQWGEEDWRYHAEDRGKITAACIATNAPIDFFSVNNYPWSILGHESQNGQWGISFTKFATRATNNPAGVPVLYSETGFTSSETMWPGMNEFRQGPLVRNSLWESLEAGALGTHIFSWMDRPYITDREKGFGILTADRRVKASFWTSRDCFNLMNQAQIENLLMGSKDPKPDIAFLWTAANDSQYNRYECEMQQMAGAFERLGFEPNFMNLNDLASGAYTNFKVVVLPRNMRVDAVVPGYTNSVLNFLLTKVIATGVHVLASADLPGLQDANGRPRADFTNEVAALFGIDASDPGGTEVPARQKDYVSSYWNLIMVDFNTNSGPLSGYRLWPFVWKYSDEIKATNGGVVWATMNTLRNKGFEDSSVAPAGWSTYGPVAVIVSNPAFAYQGQNCLSLDSNACIWADFPAVPFGRYTASTYLRNSATNPLNGTAAYIAIEWLDKNQQLIGVQESVHMTNGASTNSWQKFSVDALAPSNTYAGRRIIRVGNHQIGANMLKNSGLDFGVAGDGTYAPVSWTTHHPDQQAFDSGHFRGGPNSWAFWYDGFIWQDVTSGFQQGDQLAVGGWLYTPSNDALRGGTKSGAIVVEFRNSPVQTNVIAVYTAGVINASSSKDQWLNVEKNVTVPAGATFIRILVRCLDYSSGNGRFLADDVYLRKDGIQTSGGRGTVYVDNESTAPAVVVKNHGTAKAAIFLYTAGDIAPDGTLDGKPDVYAWKWRFDVFGALLTNSFNVKPTVSLSGTNAFLCLPEYRTLMDGSTLWQIKNYLYETNFPASWTNLGGGSPQTFVMKSSLFSGRTVRALSQGRILTTNCNGTLSLTLDPDGMEMLHVFYVSPTAVSTQAAGFWKFEELSWTGAVGEVKDSSGNANHGRALNGAQTVPTGRFGRGTWFDGTNDSVQIPSSASLQLTNDLTISFWIRPKITTSRINPVDKKYGGEFALTIETNGSMTYYHGSSTTQYWSWTAIPAGRLANCEWQHVAVTRVVSNRAMRCYLNGSQVASTTYSTNALTWPTASTNPVCIGRGYTGATLLGMMDEVKIAGLALSSNQVLAECLNRQQAPVVQIADAPSEVHPMGDKSFQMRIQYDCLGASNLTLKVAFAENGDNGDGITNEIYQSISSNVSGSGAATCWMWIPDYNRNDADYLSTPDGGKYVFKAWLENGSNTVVATALPMATDLRWGVRPTAATQLPVPDALLRAYWKFDEGSGTNCLDQTTNHLNGTVRGTAEWVTGKTGTALSFTDSAPYMAVGPISLGSNWTIAAWFKYPLATVSSWNTLTRGASLDHQVIVQASSSLLGSYDNTSGGFLSSGFKMSSLTSGWHHVVAVGSAGVTTFYVDGQLVGSVSFQSRSDIVAIGNYQGGGQPFGTIDNVALYGTALTEPQIAAEYTRYDTPATAQLPTTLQRGASYWIPFEWEDLYETLSWEVTPLTRNGAFPSRIAIFRSSKTEKQFPGQFARVNQVCDWLESRGYSSGNPLDLLFDNISVTDIPGTPPVPPTPLAHWALNEGAGTNAADDSGHGYVARFTGGATWTTGKTGQALGCAASGAYMFVTNLTLSSNWTIAAWFKYPLATEGSDWNTLARGSAADHHIIVQRSSGMLGQFVGNFYSSGFNMTSLSSGWHHVAAVGSQGATKYYIDGLCVGTCAVQTLANIYAIGNYQGGGQPFGAVDEVAVYNVALSAAQVAGDYAKCGGTVNGARVFSDNFEDGNTDGWRREAGCANWTVFETAVPLPVAYHSFNEGSGSTAHDATGHGYDLTLGAGGWNGTPASFIAGKYGFGGYISSGGGGGWEVAYAIPSTPIPMGSVWTISTWFRWPLPYGTNWLHYLCNDNGSPERAHVTMNGTLGANGVSCGFSPTNLTAGWHHLAAIGTGGVTRFYIDAQYVGVATSQVTGSIAMMGNSYSYDHSWGAVDEFRVFNTALSMAAISNEIRGPASLRIARIGNDDNICRASAIPAARSRWAFDEGSGATAYDSVGTCNGTLTGNAAWTTGRTGQALACTNSAAYLDVGGIPLPSDWSIAAWFKYPLATEGSDWNTLTRGSSADHHIIVQRSSGLLGSYVGSFYSSGFNVTTLTSGWHHLVAVGSQGRTTFYVDGACVGTSAVQTLADIKAVGNYQSGGQPFGVVDDVTLYTGAFNPTQVSDLYAGRSISESLSWTNFTVSADVQYKKQDHYFSNADLFFRYVDRDNFYKIGIRNYYGFWRVMYEIRYTGAVQSVGILYEFSKTNQPTEGVWYKLSVDAVNTNADIWFNGQKITSLPLRYVQAGGIAVGSKAPQLGIWDPQYGYYFIDDDELSRWAPEGEPTPSVGTPLNLDWGYLATFFPTLILPSTYVMSDVEVANVTTWLTNGLRCLIATDGGVAMRDETGATRLGRIEGLFGVAPSLNNGLSGLNRMVIGTNDHYVTLDYSPGTALPLTNGSVVWMQPTSGVALSAAMYDTNPAPAMIANVLRNDPQVPKKTFCFNFAADTGGQLTNALSLLGQRVLEWAQGEAYKVTLELKMSNGNVNLDPVLYTTNAWVLGGTGQGMIRVTIPSDGTLTGDNLYWAMYVSAWDATNAWLAHGGFYSTLNDGGSGVDLGGVGLQILGVTDRAYAGRSWDMWVGYSTRGEILAATYGIKDKESQPILFEENFDVPSATINSSGSYFGDGWLQEEWGGYYEVGVTNGYFRAHQVASGYSKVRHEIGSLIMNRNCTLEFDVFYETENAAVSILYQDRGPYGSPGIPALAAAPSTTGIWHHVTLHVRDGWVYDYYVNGDAVKMGEPLPGLNPNYQQWIGFFAFSGDFRIDNIRLTDEKYSVTTVENLFGQFVPTNKSQVFWPSVPDYDTNMWEHCGTTRNAKYEWYAQFRGKKVHAAKDTEVYFAPRLMVEETNFPLVVEPGTIVSVPVDWEGLRTSEVPAKLHVEMSDAFVGESVGSRDFTIGTTEGAAYFNVTISNRLRAGDNYLWSAYLYPTGAVDPYNERMGLDDTFRFDTWGRPFNAETIISVTGSIRSPYIVYGDAGLAYRSAIYTWGTAPTTNWNGDFFDASSPEGFKCFRTEAASGYGIGWGIFKAYRGVAQTADMSMYTNGYLKFWLKSADPMTIELEGPQGTKRSVTVDTTSNAWKAISLSMTNFTPTVVFSNIYSLFSINRGGLGTFYVDHVRWETGAGATNYSPTVYAGPDQIVYLPQATTGLRGVVKDDGLPYGTLNVLWQKMSGPALVIDDPHATNAVVSFVSPGTYVLRLKADDGEYWQAYDDMILSVRGIPTNGPPIVEAGANQLVELSVGADLWGMAADDGLPSNIVTVAWTKVSGPGTVTFANASAQQTHATFSAAGTYVLRLTASDTLLSRADDVTIQVAVNTAPVVNAGADQAFFFPQTATLDGTATDDGLPTAYLDPTWTKVSGPGTVTFGNSKAVDTTATFSQPGSYTLRLTVSDTAASNYDDLVVNVMSNNPPAVEAGTNQSIVRPSSAVLDGTVTDDGKPTNAVLTTLWTKESGPGEVTFGNSNAVDTTASFSLSGIYVLKLTANDGLYQISDTVTITVSSGGSSSGLGNGSTLGGVISANGEIDWYEISCASGEVVCLRMTPEVTPFTPTLQLYTPASQLVASANGGDDYGTTMIEYRALTSGPFRVACSEYYGTRTGPYLLSSAWQTPTQPLDTNDTDIGWITNGQTRVGTFGKWSDMDVGWFNAVSGEVVNVRVTPQIATETPRVSICDPSGSVVADTWGGDNYGTALLESRLTKTGQYTIRIMEYYGSRTGTYAVSMLWLTPGHSMVTNNPGIGALTNGETKIGAISQWSEMETATFNMSSGEVVNVRITPRSTPFMPRFTVYDPTGASIGDTWCGDDYATGMLELRPQKTGQYTMRIMEYYGSRTGTYTVSMLWLTSGHAMPTNNPGVGAITNGETKVGTIGQWSEMETAMFNASSGEVVNIRITPQSTPFMPRFTVYDPTGASIGDTWCGDDYASGMLELRLPKTGQYTIRIMEYYGSRTGTYTMSILWLTPGHELVGGNPGIGWITNGETKVGTISQWSEMETAKFMASSGEVVHLRLAPKSSPFLPQMAIYDQNGSQVTYANAGDGDGTATLEVRPRLTGQYTIRIMEYYGSRTGTYVMSMMWITPGHTMPTNNLGPGWITNGETKVGTISQWTQMHPVMFNAASGEVVHLRLAPMSSPFLPQMAIYDQTGSQVTYANAGDGDGTATLEVRPQKTGQYTIRMMEYYGSRTGTYVMSMMWITPGHTMPTNNLGPGWITNGETKVGTISQWTQMHPVMFNAASGEVVHLRLAPKSSPFLPQMAIYDQNGSQVTYANAGDGDGTATLEVRPRLTGQYTIRMMEYYGSRTGTYVMSMMWINPGHTMPTNNPGLGWITNGETKVGTIGQWTEMEPAMFMASSGEVVQLRLAPMSSPFLPQMAVYDKNGNYVTYANAGDGDGTATLEVKPQVTGQYTVRLMEYYGSRTGTYVMSMMWITPGHTMPTNNPGLGWITNGETKVGTLAQWTEVEPAMFMASSGEVVNVRVTPLNTPFMPRFTIYDALGTAVSDTWCGDGYATGMLESRLPRTGQYTIRIFEYYGSRTGTYAMSMAWVTPGHDLVASEPEIGLMTNGAARSATLAQWADMDTAWFTATSGQTARITMGRKETTNTLTSLVTLYSPSGTQVSYTSSDDTATLSNRLTATGTYTIRCMDYYGSRKGNYQVGLTIYP